MAFTAGFSVNVGDPTKASDVDVLAANDDYLKNAIDTFIANDADNRVLTGTGSGTANAETNLTFDGSTLTVTGTVSATTFNGNVTGNLTGDVTGNISGNVTGGTISGTTGLYTSTLATSAGDIGVGTHSPSGLGARTLNIKAASSAGADLTIEADNGNNFGVFFSGATASDPFSIFSNTGFKFATASDKNATGFDEHMRITSTGVGINCTPKDTLHVKIGTNLNWQFGYPNNSVTTLAALNDTESAYVTARIDAGTLELNGQSGGDVNLGAGVLVVDTSADRVGINTSSPQVDFHVDNASTNGVARISTSHTSSYAQLQLVNQSGNYWYQTIVNADNSYRLYNGSDRLIVDTSGIMGLGVTPSAWSGRTALEIEGASTGYVTSPNGPIAIGSNIYYNGGDKFVGNGYAPLYALSSGNHIWYTSNNNTSGAGAAVTLTQAMTLTNAGLLGVGAASPLSGLHISDGVAYGSPQNASRKGTLTISAGTEASADLQFLNANYNHIFFGDSADPNVGTLLYDHTNNSMQFAVNGSERLRITSGGTIEIPNQNAINELVFTGTEFTNVFSNTTSGMQFGTTGAGSYLSLYSANAEAIRIDSSQRVGIGTASPQYKLVVSNGGAAGYEFNVNGLNSGVNTVVYNRSTSAYVDSAHFVNNYYIYSGQTPAERFRVESTGVCAFMTPNINIRFNGTATQSVLTNNDGVEIYTGGYIWAGRQAASLYLNRAGTTGDVAVFYYNNTTAVGSISVTSTATAYNTSSDYRLKENLVPITGAVDRVNALQPRRFNFISDPDTTVDGFVAHEVSPIVPESVSGEKDAVDEDGNPEYQGIDQSKLVPLLTAAIQELTARIEALEAA